MKSHTMSRMLFVSRIQAAASAVAKSRFDGVYFGHEFCEHLIPSPEQVKKTMEFSRNKSLSFHLVLPVCLEGMIEKVRVLINLLPEKTEVIFNDWGTLSLIHEAGMTPVAGRLLFSHPADPLAVAYCDTDDSHMVDYFKTLYPVTDLMKEFLLKNNILRVEYDNLFQKVSIDLPSSMKASLYYPYVYITTGRKCITRFAATGKNVLGFGDCKKYCSLVSTEMIGRGHDRKILLKGNTQFYFNDKVKIPKEMEKSGMDRLIYMPEFPY